MQVFPELRHPGHRATHLRDCEDSPSWLARCCLSPNITLSHAMLQEGSSTDQANEASQVLSCFLKHTEQEQGGWESQ